MRLASEALEPVLRPASVQSRFEALLTRGLETLQTLPESPERDRRELAFQIAIGTPLIALQGYSAPETGAAYSRARVLCERLGEAEPLASVRAQRSRIRSRTSVGGRFAEQEAKAISVRTKAALAAAKVRGVKLGGPKLKQAQRNGWKTNTVNADRFAANVRPVIEKLRASGATSLRAIAAELAARNIPTARGGTWTPVQVTAILRRRHDSSSIGPTGG
jgi:Recombinase